MSRLVWTLRCLWRTVGPAGICGLILLLGIALFHWGVLIQERTDLDAMQAQSVNLAARLAQQRLQPASLSTEEQLAQFYSVLPETSGAVLADTLEKLYALGHAEALVLEQGSYRLASEASEPLARFDIVFPVKGSYPQLRRFMAKALRDIPALALESVSFNRQSIGDASVDAQLRFTLYLRSAL